MAPTDYLRLKGRTWFVRVQIPAALRAAAGGKQEYVKSLKTGDLNEANRLKHAYVAAFQRRIAALGHQKPIEIDEVYNKALSFREALERHKDDVLYEAPDGAVYTAVDEFLGQISDEAKELLETRGEKVADAFYKIAKGEGTLLRTHIESWLTEIVGTVSGQTISQHRTVINALLNWTGGDALIEDFTRKRAGEYVAYLLTPASHLTRRTAKRYVSSLSSYWRWLEARGLTEGNPWRGQALGAKSKRGETAKRSQWTDDALMKVLTGTHTRQYTAIFHDLVRLALVTGARLDELCALKVEDVQERRDGWWFTIREGKTNAALRDIPVHDSVAHVLNRRLSKSKNFLFEGLTPGGPDNKRSWNVSKAFGLYTKKLKLGDARQVFHALRNTFIEAMEQAEVFEPTVKLIVGHARQSMTYGHYSKGQRVELRKAINKLRYSTALMRLLRTETTTSTSQGPRRAVKATQGHRKAKQK